MRDIEIKSMIEHEKLRVVKTIKERDYNDDASILKINAHILFREIEPNENFFQTLMLLRNYKDRRLKYVTGREMFVQYGEWKYYPENEWEELVSFKHYQGSKRDLYTWASYVVPRDAAEGERFYIPDIIGDIVAEEFWGSTYRAKDGVGIWNGNDIQIDKSIYKETFLIG